MITEDQAAVIEFLESPPAHGGAAVERIETHSSIVFMAGERALKLKRAVVFDYLDFSTSERRRMLCEAEVRLNRRTAPGLYRGVVAVTREPDGSLALGGAGAPVDWLVDMHRFDQAALLDRLAQDGRLELAGMGELAATVASFHAGAELRRDKGGRAGMAWVVDGNEAGFREFGQILDPVASQRLTGAVRAELERQGSLLEARRQAGWVRQCHGDLHLRNIVMLDGRPTPFDAIEFNDDLACNDVLYDLAFLLMDLWHRRLPRHANAVWNRYLLQAGDLTGLPLMPLFLSCRAAVRAKTSATSASQQSDPERRVQHQTLAREYQTLAEALLQPPKASLIAVGGLSGTGKSTLALSLAPSVGAVPGAVVLRTDEVRKQLCGVAPTDRLGPEGYTAEMSRRVYATVAERARLVVDAGHAAIVDGVFTRPADREAIERVASDAAVRFAGLWLEAPKAILIDRVTRRTLDPSDATADVVRTQLAEEKGEVAWRRLDASLAAPHVLASALAAVS